uniref:Phosphatidylethanolamine-binding protein 4 n=1 Tax=Anser cygnoides TaxID=8845 RepID=A0A8B9ELD8_ANSCY
MNLNAGNPLSCAEHPQVVQVVLLLLGGGGWEKRQTPQVSVGGFVVHKAPSTQHQQVGSSTPCPSLHPQPGRGAALILPPAPLSLSLPRGDLEVTYPQLGDVGCSYIPQCHQYRWRLSREWGSPRVRYPRADKSKKYVLMLVDPDAPSRADPRNRFWRHWLLADVRGTDLRTGDLKGRVLTDYVRPTPPPRSGYHRYQLRLYEQPAGQHIALGPEELLSLGAWAMESFVERFRLGSPVASTQFLTKHHED